MIVMCWRWRLVILAIACGLLGTTRLGEWRGNDRHQASAVVAIVNGQTITREQLLEDAVCIRSPRHLEALVMRKLAEQAAPDSRR